MQESARPLLRGSAMFRKCHLTSCILALGLSGAVSAVAQDDDVIDPTPVSCLSMNLVRLTTAIDDSNVLFYLRDGRIYLNFLEQNCPGLRRNNRFSYNLRTGARIPRLCHTDTITVIEPTGSGFTCRLSPFYPLSENRAEQLLMDANQLAADTTIVTEVENPPDQEEADEGE